MKLGEAITLLGAAPFACACVGPLPGCRVCPCTQMFTEARALVKAGQTVLQLLQTLNPAESPEEVSPM